jgi:AcrR family transcriptional regulator
VVRNSIAGTADRIASADSVESVLQVSAALSLDRREAPTLWQREARHLSNEDRVELWQELRTIGDSIGALIARERTDLDADDVQFLAWAVTCTFSSVSFHRITLPRRSFESLLVEIGRAVVACPLDAGTPDPVVPDMASALPVSTRESLLNEAVRLFDQRGFRSVSTDDIGEAAGTSGPNIYKHFTTKLDLLEAAVLRAGERRRAATAHALAGATDPPTRLHALLEAYVRFAVENRHLLGVLASELDQLPEIQRRASRQSQRDFLALWVSLLDQVRPGLEPKTARITVLAALTIVDNLVRTPQLNWRPDLAARLVEVCTAVLLNGDQALAPGSASGVRA